jgi:hypothetical protein
VKASSLPFSVRATWPGSDFCVSLSERGEGESFDLLNESIFAPADSSDVSLSENLFLSNCHNIELLRGS